MGSLPHGIGDVDLVMSKEGSAATAGGIFGRGVRIENARNVVAHGNQAKAQQPSLCNRIFPSAVLILNAEVSFHMGVSEGQRAREDHGGGGSRPF